ncbi:hypothetical protein BZA77DRAFT_374877 [Pyronema omphalodes]|nr:hypothetical protein BZA77DRAFT_374877 [Pyronema omphalodes]
MIKVIIFASGYKIQLALPFHASYADVYTTLFNWLDIDEDPCLILMKMMTDRRLRPTSEPLEDIAINDIVSFRLFGDTAKLSSVTENNMLKITIRTGASCHHDITLALPLSASVADLYCALYSWLEIDITWVNYDEDLAPILKTTSTGQPLYPTSEPLISYAHETHVSLHLITGGAVQGFRSQLGAAVGHMSPQMRRQQLSAPDGPIDTPSQHIRDIRMAITNRLDDEPDMEPAKKDAVMDSHMRGQQVYATHGPVESPTRCIRDNRMAIASLLNDDPDTEKETF